MGTTALPPVCSGETADSDHREEHHITMSRILVFSLLVALAVSGPLTSLLSPGPHVPSLSLGLVPGHAVPGAGGALHIVKRSLEEDSEDGEPEPEPESEPEPEAD